MNHTLYSHYDRNRRAHRKSNQLRYADRQTRYHGNAFMRPMELKRMAREETADGPLLKGKPVCCPVVPGGRQHHFLLRRNPVCITSLWITIREHKNG